MRRLVSGCAAVSLAIGTLGVGGALGTGGAQAASSTTASASAAGTSMRADFNRDGFADLAVGAPGTIGGGAVHVIYGSRSGLTANRDQYWTEGNLGIIGSQVSSFGQAVAAGDFDGDGFTDLAVGAPGKNRSQGVVHVIYGSRSGLTARRNQLWDKDSVGINGTAMVGEGFGSSLAAANFGKSGQADLVVGAATNDFTEDGVPIFSGSGSVNVIYGSAGGLTAAGNQYWTQDSPGIYGKARNGDGFGSALAAANFGKSGYADLAIGAPGDNLRRGEVNVIYGSARGLTAAGGQYWTQDSAGIFGTVEQGDFFGGAVAAGDFDRDGFADLAVGALGENGFRGAVNVIYGSANGLTACRDQYWHQDSPGIIGRAAEGESFGSALAVGDFDGNGFADLAVGAPRNNRSRGSVNVLYGSTRRLTAAGNEYWTEDSPGIIGVAAPIDQFGWSMVGRR